MNSEIKSAAKLFERERTFSKTLCTAVSNFCAVGWTVAVAGGRLCYDAPAPAPSNHRARRESRRSGAVLETAMRRSKSSPNFSGRLAEPIYEPVAGGILGDDAARKERIINELTETFDLVPLHYGVDVSVPDGWQKLSIMLALDLIPGMQVISSKPKSRGRKRTWKAGRSRHLYHAVQDSLKAGSPNIRAAIVQLNADAEWSDCSRENLEARYYEASRIWQGKYRIAQALLAPQQPPLGMFALGIAALANLRG